MEFTGLLVKLKVHSLNFKILTENPILNKNMQYVTLLTRQQ